MKKLFIIAGNHSQYKDWCIRAQAACRYPDYHYIYVSTPDTLRGEQDPQGICIGNWRDRSDAAQILHTLACTITDREKLTRVQNLQRELVTYYQKPLPKWDFK